MGPSRHRAVDVVVQIDPAKYNRKQRAKDYLHCNPRVVSYILSASCFSSSFNFSLSSSDRSFSGEIRRILPPVTFSSSFLHEFLYIRIHPVYLHFIAVGWAVLPPAGSTAIPRRLILCFIWVKGDAIVIEGDKSPNDFFSFGFREFSHIVFRYLLIHCDCLLCCPPL